MLAPSFLPRVLSLIVVNCGMTMTSHVVAVVVVVVVVVVVTLS